MLKIQRSSNGQVVFTLSGQIDAEEIAELEAVIKSEANGPTIVLGGMHRKDTPMKVRAIKESVNESTVHLIPGRHGCRFCICGHSGEKPCAAYCCSTRTIGDGIRRASWRMDSYKDDSSYKSSFLSHCQRPQRSHFAV